MFFSTPSGRQFMLNKHKGGITNDCDKRKPNGRELEGDREGERKMDRKWDELDMDCLINIFERLELQELILGVAFVCKSWYRASVSPQCWKTLNFDKLNFAPSSSPFVTTFCHQYAIHNFSVSGFLTLALSRGGPAVVEIILPAICTLEKLIYASNM